MSVNQQRRRDVARLADFWPQWGIPFVFCDIIGEENEVHTGRKDKARVGLESKFNVKEARKIVSDYISGTCIMLATACRLV